jgi:enolase
MVINDLKAFQILDSRGNFTTQVIFICSHGEFKASCPSGASVGFKEAVEIRDADKSVKSVCENINANIKKLICGKNFSTIKEFDDFLLKIDGTTNKSNLGANCTLPLSIAFTRAIAALNKLPIYEYIRKIYNFNSSIPIPMINLINGGCHANNKLSIQEFMIVPNTTSYKESIEVAVKVFTCLKIILTQQNKSLSLGDEGGYCAFFENTHDALDTLVLAIKKSGYLDTKIALDVAANELLLSDGHYLLDNKKYSSKELVHFYEEIILKYPIISIEDGLSESDFSGWVINGR